MGCQHNIRTGTVYNWTCDYCGFKGGIIKVSEDTVLKTLNPKVYLVDMDGTIADASHRLHTIQNLPKDWKAFYELSKDDSPIYEVLRVVQGLEAVGHHIFIVTGRSEECREGTVSWLIRNDVPWLWLYMRKEGDHREDFIVKSELLDKLLKESGLQLSDIGGAFEDRQQVVDMYRERGIKVFQVAKGNF